MLIGVDHEYIPENAAQGDVPGERPDVTSVYCEIMQMGACKLNESGRELAVLNRIVSAHRIDVIPPWLSKMTGMTAERRQRYGIPFPEAFAILIQFLDGHTPWTFMGDEHVLRGNLRAYGMLWPFDQSFQLVKPRLAGWGVTLADYQRQGFVEMNSGNLHKVLGIELPAIEGVGAHDAAHDARSLTHSVHQLMKGA